VTAWFPSVLLTWLPPELEKLGRSVQNQPVGGYRGIPDMPMGENRMADLSALIFCSSFCLADARPAAKHTRSF
jgi:hypothetical protein